jgi:hypothetical protein
MHPERSARRNDVKLRDAWMVSLQALAEFLSVPCSISVRHDHAIATRSIETLYDEAGELLQGIAASEQSTP